jgi:hypothetical protein
MLVLVVAMPRVLLMARLIVMATLLMFLLVFLMLLVAFVALLLLTATLFATLLLVALLLLVTHFDRLLGWDRETDRAQNRSGDSWKRKSDSVSSGKWTQRIGGAQSGNSRFAPLFAMTHHSRWSARHVDPLLLTRGL